MDKQDISDSKQVNYGLDDDLVQSAHRAGKLFTSKITRSQQKALGQFMTPPAVAQFMAERLVASHDQPCMRVLEPSGGAGILIAAVVQASLNKPRRPERIEVLIYEQDPDFTPILESICEKLKQACEERLVAFDYVIRCEDFLLSDLALAGQPIDGLLTIANPPFFKLNKSTDLRAKMHSYAVYGQPNVYALFMAATARLTPLDGGWCFIVPRSWMNGQYFRATRNTLFHYLNINSIHAFESRRDSFQEDAVLQETVIAWASGRSTRAVGSTVLVTRSQGSKDLCDASIQAVPAEHVVDASKSASVKLPASDDGPFKQWASTLGTYGLKVSTGPVVAFRAKRHLRARSGKNTVPLLWLQHIKPQTVNWPIQKKAEHILATAETAWMLLPNAPMLVMRRFSPKEDLRRVTCAPYFGSLQGQAIGLENHLNYIHRPGGCMSADEIRGLSAFLMSRWVDDYLRATAGSTQINASELRDLPLPALSTIESIGRGFNGSPSLDEIDRVVGEHIDQRTIDVAA